MTVNCPVCKAENDDTAITCITCGYHLTSMESEEEQLHSDTLLQLHSDTLLRGGRYRIDKTLGQGGFGITYKGTNLADSESLAIKELFPPERSARQGTRVIWPSSITPKARQEQIEKFKYEAECLSKCLHPNIVRVHAWFEENNTAYIVMAFIEGKPLSKLFTKEKPLPESRVKHYFLQVAEALKVVHSNNLLHRDIKPDNIIIDTQDRAILIDFGSAREFIASKTNKMTQSLTEGYAPLEQYTSEGRRGSSTDFYAFCASMYELLTGELPCRAMERVREKPLIPPRQKNPSISPLMEQIILTGMRMRVEERFQTADELIDALEGKFVSPSLRKARQLVQQGNLLEAHQAYEKCLANEPNNGEASVELALVLTYVDDSKAAAAAHRAIQLKPNDGRVYGVLGLVNCRQSNWPETVNQLQQAAKLAPNESWILANLAWALGKSDKWQQARAVVDRAIQLDSNSTFALGLKGWIAVKQRKWKEAICAARQAITKSKQTNSNHSKELQSWVYPYLTVALDRALVGKHTTDLDRCLQEFTNQVPDSAFVDGFKGWKLASQGRWAEAVSSFEQASRKAGVSAWVFWNLGITYEQLRKPQAAIQAYQDYIRTFGDNAFTLFRLGTLLGCQGQWPQARSCLEKAVQLKPDYAEAYHNLAWVLLNIRSESGQVENFHQMRSAYYKAAELYERQRKHAVAHSIRRAFKVIGIEI